MFIDDLIEKLKKVRAVEGNIQVTCTGSLLPDDHGKPIPDVFESTVENFQVGEHPKIGRRVRLFM